MNSVLKLFESDLLFQLNIQMFLRLITYVADRENIEQASLYIICILRISLFFVCVFDCELRSNFHSNMNSVSR